MLINCVLLVESKSRFFLKLNVDNFEINVDIIYIKMGLFFKPKMLEIVYFFKGGFLNILYWLCFVILERTNWTSLHQYVYSSLKVSSKYGFKFKALRMQIDTK